MTAYSPNIYLTKSTSVLMYYPTKKALPRDDRDASHGSSLELEAPWRLVREVCAIVMDDSVHRKGTLASSGFFVCWAVHPVIGIISPTCLPVLDVLVEEVVIREPLSYLPQEIPVIKAGRFIADYVVIIFIGVPVIIFHFILSPLLDHVVIIFVWVPVSVVQFISSWDGRGLGLW